MYLEIGVKWHAYLFALFVLFYSPVSLAARGKCVRSRNTSALGGADSPKGSACLQALHGHSGKDKVTLPKDE